MATRIDSQAAAAAARAAAIAEARRRAAEAAAAQARARAAKAAKATPKAIARLKADGFSVARGQALGVKKVTAPVAPPPAPTPAQLGATEAQRLDALAKTDPAGAADQLKTALQNPDPAYHQSIIDGADEVSGSIAEAIKTADQPTMERSIASLAQCTAAAGSAGAQAMGKAFAEHMSEGFGGGYENVFDQMWMPKSPQAQAFLGAMLSAPGMGDFVNGMNGAARASGNEGLLRDLVGLSQTSAQMVKKGFDDASGKVDQLNGELNSLVQSFGPGDESKLAAAVADFKQRHAAEYAAFEAASQAVLNVSAMSVGMGGDLPALVEVVKLAPKALASEAGQKRLGDALQAQAGGQNPLLLQALSAAGTSDPEIAKQLGPVFTQAAGARIAELKAAGKTTEAHAVIAAFAKNAAAMGLPAGALDPYATALGNVLDGQPGALESLKLATDSVNALLPPNTPYLSSSLKSLGLVVGVLSLPSSMEGFSDAQIENQVATIASTLGLGNDGAVLAVKLLAQPSTYTAVESVLGKVGKGLGVIGALASTIDFAQAAESGNLADMTVSGLNAAASIAMCIPGGQLVGVGLAVASFVVNIFVGEARQRAAENASEGDAYSFLVASGMPEDFARVFSNLNDQKQNIGPFVDEVAQKLGMTRDQFYAKLSASQGDDRGRLVGMFAGLSHGAEVMGSMGDGGELPIFGPRITMDMFPPDMPQEARELIEPQINAVNQKRDEILNIIAAQAATLLD